MKKLGIFIVALLLMSSFASAGFWDLITGKATGPTIVGTACTSNSQCPSGQTCQACPSGATCTSVKICLAAAGTTPAAPAAVPDDFPLGSSVIELCRYSEGPYGTTAGRGDRYQRAYSKNTLRLVQRDEYTFEATDIKSDGTLTLKVTKEEGVSGPKKGPYTLTLTEDAGKVYFGNFEGFPAGQRLDLVKYPGITEHQYLKSRGTMLGGYNRMDGKCASFLVAPSSWENINLPFDTPFGTVVSTGNGDGIANVQFKNGLRYSVRSTGSLNEDSASTTVVVYSMSNVFDSVEVARDTVNKGESKVIGPLRIQFDGTYRDGSTWRAGLAISDKNAQVAAPAAASAVTPSLVAKTPTVTAQKKPGLMARLFEKKTAANLPAAAPSAAAPAEAATPAGCDIAPAEYSLMVGESIYFNGKKVKLERLESDLVSAGIYVDDEFGVISYSGELNGLNIKVSSVQKRKLAADSSVILVVSCPSSSAIGRPVVPSTGAAGCELVDVGSIEYATKTGNDVCLTKGKKCQWEFWIYHKMFFDSSNGRCDGKVQMDIPYYVFYGCDMHLASGTGVSCQNEFATKDYAEPMAGDTKSPTNPFQVLCCK